MMSLMEIEYQARQAARRSQKLGLEPFVITQEHKDAGDIDAVGKKIPNLGDRVPKGWRRVDPTIWYDGRVRGVYEAGFFVDSSGFGGEHEPALTPRQFLEMAKPGYGYGIVEAGQFQVHIGVFETTGGKRVHPERVRIAATVERNKLAGKIERLAEKLSQRKSVPQPEPGDCFFCQGMVTSMQTGQKAEPAAASCLAAHVEDGYLHGSLVRNALLWARPGDPKFATIAEAADALRRYLRHHLGFEGGGDGRSH